MIIVILQTSKSPYRCVIGVEESPNTIVQHSG